MKLSKSYRIWFAICSAVALFAQRPADAQQQAVNWTSGGTEHAGDYTIGYQFTVVNPLSVVSLGIYDAGQNGLTSSHQVGIWDITGGGVQVAGATVSAGTVDPLVGFFRYHTITPVLLIAGHTYDVAGLTGNQDDTWLATPTGLVANPKITFVGTAYHPGVTFTRPDTHDPGVIGYFGGSFQLTSTPEASSFMLLALGLIPVGFGVYRNRRKTRFELERKVNV